MGVLRGVPDCQLAGGRGVAGQRGARLHRVGDQALLDDRLLDHDIGLGKRFVDVAAPGDRPVERLVARDLGVQLGRAVGGSLLGLDHGIQRIVVDLDQVQRVVCLVTGLGDHDRDDVANVPNGVPSDAVIVGDRQPRVGEQPGTRRGSDLSLGVRADVNRHHALRGGGLRSVDAVDAGVSVRAAQQGRVQRARQSDVVGVARAASDQPRVLPPPDARAESRCAHDVPPCIVSAASRTARTMFW